MNFKSDNTIIFYLEDAYFKDFSKEIFELYPDLSSPDSGITATALIDVILSAASDVLNIKEFIFNYAGNDIYKNLKTDGVALQFMVQSEHEAQQLKSLVNHDFLITASAHILAQIPPPLPPIALPPNTLVANPPFGSYESVYGSFLKSPNTALVVKAIIDNHFLNNALSPLPPSTPSLKI